MSSCRVQVLERLGDFWSSCAQLRSQLTFLSIKYPLTVEALLDEKDQPFLRATATVMFPSLKSKALISFLLDKETYSRWPLSVRGLKADVRVAYGIIKYVHDARLEKKRALMAMSQARGCLERSFRTLGAGHPRG